MATGERGKKKDKNPPARRRGAAKAATPKAAAPKTAAPKTAAPKTAAPKTAAPKGAASETAGAGQEARRAAVEKVSNSIQEMMATSQRQIENDLRLFGQELEQMRGLMTETVQGMQAAHAGALRQAMDTIPAAVSVAGQEQPQPAAGSAWAPENVVPAVMPGEEAGAWTVAVDPGEEVVTGQADLESLAEAAGQQAIKATAQAVESTGRAAMGIQEHGVAVTAVSAGTSSDQEVATETAEATPGQEEDEDSVGVSEGVVRQALYSAAQVGAGQNEVPSS